MKSEKGQAMVLIALALVGLIAIVGLAIDGGRQHNDRRQAQNAADAAALAGTRQLTQLRIDMCESATPSANAIDDAVASAILEYAGHNGVENDGSTGQIRAWYVDADSNVVKEAGVHALTLGDLASISGVRVGLAMTDTTTFMRIVGRQDMTVGTNATAMFGPVTQMGGGILPIGVPLEVVLALDPGEEFHILETNQHNGGSFCTDPNNEDTCIGDPAAHNAHRGWLNLNYIYNTAHLSQSDPFYRTFEASVPNRGCGTDPNSSVDDGLQGWAGDSHPNGPCPYPHPIFAGRAPLADGTCFTDGDFIHGDPGARDSSAQAVEDMYAGTLAYAPIFDHIYMSDYMDDNFTEPEGGIGWPRAGGGGHAFLYHIVGFVGMDVIEYQRGGSEGKAIVGAFRSAIIGQGQISPGQGPLAGSADPCTPTLYAVTLWE